MNKKFLLLLTAITILFMASCSSAPKKTSEVNTRKNRAADFMGFGNQYFTQGLYEQALVFFNIALDENIAADFEPGISKVCSSIARTFLLTGDFAGAEKYIQESYNLAKQLGDKDLIAISATIFAELKISKNLIPEAEKFISEAMTQAKANSAIQAEAYHTLAVIERRKGEPEKALATINKAIAINKQNKAHSNLAANYYFAASVFSQEDNYAKAVEMLNNAIKEDRLVENSFGLAKDYKALGIVSLKNNKKEEAYSFFIKSLNIFRVIENMQEQKSVLQYLIEISEDLGKISDLEYFKKQFGAIKE
jgi:tetratricopeptide (TPR) repeat protein